MLPVCVELTAFSLVRAFDSTVAVVRPVFRAPPHSVDEYSALCCIFCRALLLRFVRHRCRRGYRGKSGAFPVLSFASVRSAFVPHRGHGEPAPRYVASLQITCSCACVLDPTLLSLESASCLQLTPPIIIRPVKLYTVSIANGCAEDLTVVVLALFMA